MVIQLQGMDVLLTAHSNVLLGNSFRTNHARIVETNVPNANLPPHAKHATKQQTTSFRMIPVRNVL